MNTTEHSNEQILYFILYNKLYILPFFHFILIVIIVKIIYAV